MHRQVDWNFLSFRDNDTRSFTHSSTKTIQCFSIRLRFACVLCLRGRYHRFGFDSALSLYAIIISHESETKHRHTHTNAFVVRGRRTSYAYIPTPEYVFFPLHFSFIPIVNLFCFVFVGVFFGFFFRSLYSRSVKGVRWKSWKAMVQSPMTNVNRVNSCFTDWNDNISIFSQTANGTTCHHHHKIRIDRGVAANTHTHSTYAYLHNVRGHNHILILWV